MSLTLGGKVDQSKESVLDSVLMFNKTFLKWDLVGNMMIPRYNHAVSIVDLREIQQDELSAFGCDNIF